MSETWQLLPHHTYADKGSGKPHIMDSSFHDPERRIPKTFGVYNKKLDGGGGSKFRHGTYFRGTHRDSSMRSRLSFTHLYGTFRTVLNWHRVHCTRMPQLRIAVGVKQELRIAAVPRHEILLS